MASNSSKANYLYSVAYQMLAVLTPLLTAPYLARTIGAQGVGVYSYFQNIASYFAMAGALGLTNYGSRYIAQVRGDRNKLNYAFSGIYYLQLLCGIIVTILYILYTMFIVENNQNISWIMLLFVVAVLINLTWFYWGIEAFQVTVTRNILIKLLTIVCIFVFVRSSDDLWKYCLILSLGGLIGYIPFIFLLPKHVSFVKVQKQDIWAHLKPNLVLFVPILSVSIYRTMGKIMLGWLSTYSDVGYYENADRIIVICLGFITALGQVMMPKAAHLIAEGKINESNKLVVKAFNFSSLFCAAVVFGLLSVAEVFVPVFFGPGFDATISILYLLAPNLFLLAWGNVIKTQILMAREKDRIYLHSTIVGVIINLTVNCLMIPELKGIGAAIGTIAAELASLMYIIVRVRREIHLSELTSTVKYILNGLVMLLVVYVVKQFVREDIWGLLVLICSGAGSYIGGCFILSCTGDRLLCEIKELSFLLIKKVPKMILTWGK